MSLQRASENGLSARVCTTAVRRTVGCVLGALVIASGCAVSTASAPSNAISAEVVDDVVGDEVVVASEVGLGGEIDRLTQLLTARRPAPLPPVDPNVPDAELPPAAPPYKSGPRSESPVINPPRSLGSGDGTVFAVGDSVLLGTQHHLPTTLDRWALHLDAAIGRRFPEGIDIVRRNRANLGQVAVVLLGHNYGGGGKVFSYLDELMNELQDVQRVVFVTVAEWSNAQPEVNRAIRALPAVYRNVVVADWQAVSAANPQFLNYDGVHLSGSGAIALANLIAVMVGPRLDGALEAIVNILKIPDEPVQRGPTTTAPGGTTSTSATNTTIPEPSTSTSSTSATSSTTSSSSTSTSSSTSSTSTTNTSAVPTTTAPP